MRNEGSTHDAYANHPSHPCFYPSPAASCLLCSPSCLPFFPLFPPQVASAAQYVPPSGDEDSQHRATANRPISCFHPSSPAACSFGCPPPSPSFPSPTYPYRSPLLPNMSFPVVTRILSTAQPPTAAPPLSPARQPAAPRRPTRSLRLPCLECPRPTSRNCGWACNAR